MKKHYIRTFFAIVWVSCFILPSFSQNLKTSKIESPPLWALAIHGGAGGPGRDQMKPEAERQYRDSLDKALSIGAAILSSGGSSLDAVEAVIRFMENCPLFNAGKGAVYNSDGIAELDASIMDGSTLLAGAVGCVHTIKNPITAARRVLTSTPHVLLIGEGAEEFAAAQGLEIVDPSYFLTPMRTEQYQKMKKQREEQGQQPHGTVGCVALDKQGHLAAGTSTGGMMMKMKGRMGDTPIIGAGTYASDATCAVSCTGHGEYFIRNAVAFQVSELMKCKGVSVSAAAGEVIDSVLTPQGGTGGLIAIDAQGNITMPFNTAAMFRGYRTSDGRSETAVFK